MTGVPNNAAFLERIRRIKTIAGQRGIDGFLISKSENKYYISGFESSNYFIYLTPDKNYLLTDFRYIESAGALAQLFETVLLTSQYSVFDFLRETAQGTLGIEYKSITFDFYNDLTGKVKAPSLVSADDIIESVRIIKDKQEIESVAKAAEIGNKGFLHMLAFIRPGMTERDVALELEFFLRRNGADALAFETIIASGERGSLPHAIPSTRKISAGDFITMDFGVKVNGYCSDMTRTIGIGSLSDEQKAVYQTVLSAQMTASSAIRDGVEAAFADKAARSLIEKAGYGQYFGHGLGHGVGLEVHEAPTLNPTSKDQLKTNMLVTVEPGIYLPGKFGVRIEDLAVVTDDGIISLSTVEKELIIL